MPTGGVANQPSSRMYTAPDGDRSWCECPLPVTSSISRISPARSTRLEPSLAPDLDLAGKVNDQTALRQGMKVHLP